MYIDNLLKDENVLMLYKRMLKHSNALAVHSYQVALISLRLAKELGYSDSQAMEIAKGGLLHDFGKVYVPYLLLKKPSVLTDDEFHIIKKHPQMGFDTLCDFGFSDIVLDIALHHHEYENGTGYPYHATIMEKETKIVAFADKYDAICAPRPYKEGLSRQDGLLELRKDAGKFINGKEIYDALWVCETRN